MTNAPDIAGNTLETPPHDLLDRLVWRLFRLAGLAERAIFLPLPIRILMIWVLRPVEAVTRTLVMRALWRLGMPAHVGWELNALPPVGADVDSIEKLLRLATNLTAFAMTIQALPREVFDDHVGYDFHERAQALGHWLNAVAVRTALRRRGSACAGGAYCVLQSPSRPEVRARPISVCSGAANPGHAF